MPFNCVFCGNQINGRKLIFTRIETLRAHQIQEHKLFACPWCDGKNTSFIMNGNYLAIQSNTFENHVRQIHSTIKPVEVQEKIRDFLKH